VKISRKKRGGYHERDHSVNEEHRDRNGCVEFSKGPENSATITAQTSSAASVQNAMAWLIDLARRDSVRSWS